MAAPLTSTLNVALQAVVLILLVVAIRYAKMRKGDSLKRHHKTTIFVVIMTIIGVIFVMIPSLITYLSAGLATLPPAQLMITLVHGASGLLGLLFAILFILEVRPKKLRLYMRMTATLWSIALILGFIEYLMIAAA